MCHTNSGVQSAQIQKFVEHGMPQKIVKSVKYFLKKRAAAEQHQLEQHNNEVLDDNMECECVSNIPSNAKAIVPTEKSSLPPSPTTTIATATTTATATATSTPQSTPPTSTLTILESQLKIPKLCGRFRQMQLQQHQSIAKENITNLDNHNNANNMHMTNEKLVHVDALAVFTHLTKQFIRRINCTVNNVHNSKLYTVFTRTTQPAHVIAICILSFVLFTVWPNLIESKSSETVETVATDSSISHNENVNLNTKTMTMGRKANTLTVIAYLAAFATHFGAQIWMTFVSGLSLYFSLPRHTFGQCQQILFPKYFALNAVLSTIMLVLFIKCFLGNWKSTERVQLAALVITTLIEVIIRLYLAPPMLRLMHEKYKIEGAIGSGQEVGSIVQGDLVQCPHYQRIHKAFRRIHMTIAMGNIAVLLATSLHLYYLASKIQIS